MAPIRTTTDLRTKIWQNFPLFIASLMCVPYGIMLGWPSPTYPKLLAESTPLPITIDQTAMVAGFLMIGNIVGTPFSSWSFIGTKYGMVLGMLGLFTGWMIMWYATNIYFLLGSRFLVGLGCGYSIGQLKQYIKDFSQTNSITQIWLKLVNFYVYVGVITAYVIGYFETFTDFSLVAIVITATIFLLCLLLPHTPKEYVALGKMSQAVTLLNYLKPHNTNYDKEINEINMALEHPNDDLTIFQVLKKNHLRKPFFIIGLLTFFMQFTGAPSTIIYTQIILTASNCPFPELFSIAYIVLFFFSNFLGIFCFGQFNKKVLLLVSTFGVCLALAFNIAVFYLKLNEKHWNYFSVISLFLYIFLHSIGLAVVPFMLTQTYFPSNAVKVVSHFQIMQHSALALIITKIFQVLYDVFELYVPFCLYICIAFVCFFFVLIFVPYDNNVQLVLKNGPKLRNSTIQF